MSERVVTVALLLTTPGWRGSGTSFRKIAAGLVRHGHRVVMVAGDPAVAAALAQPGVDVRHVPTGDTGRREVRAVARVFRDHQVAVVLADSPRDVRIARYASVLSRRAIAWRYNLSRRNVPPDPLQRWLFGGLAAVVQQSAFGTMRLRDGMAWLRPRREVTIGNGFDPDEFLHDDDAGDRWRAAHGFRPDQHLVLTVGALVDDKQPEIALAALAGSGATWLVAGDGPLQDALSAAAGRVGIRTVFLGHLASAELHDVMRAADLVLQPSPAELFPNAVAEAMALGRPVLGAASGATPEVIGAAGLLFPSGDGTAAARRVAALLADDVHRAALGALARVRISECYPLAAMDAGYDRLVRSLA